MDNNNFLADFLNELTGYGFVTVNEMGFGYRIPEDLRYELSEGGFPIKRIDFEALIDGKWKECTIYCLEEHEEDAAYWILKEFGTDCDSPDLKEKMKICPYVKCRWDRYNEGDPCIAVPVKLLVSINQDDMIGENVFKTLEIMNF